MDLHRFDMTNSSNGSGDDELSDSFHSCEDRTKNFLGSETNYKKFFHKQRTASGKTRNNDVNSPTPNFNMDKNSSSSSSSDDEDNYSNNFVKQNDNGRGKTKDLYQEQFYENASNDDTDQETLQKNTEYTEQNFSHKSKSGKRKTSTLSEDNNSDPNISKKRKSEASEDGIASFKAKKSHESTENLYQEQFYENASNDDTDQETLEKNAEYTEQNFSHKSKSGKRKSTTLSEDNSSDPNISKKRKLEAPEDGIASFKSKKSHESTENLKQEAIATESSSAFGKDDKASRMMKKMGYKAGEGLGKKGQGRLEPVQVAKQFGRAGVGHHVPGVDYANLKWEPAEEKITVVEEMEWLPNDHCDILTGETLKCWMKLGPKKETINDETNFCTAGILNSVLSSKSIFDSLPGVELRRARTRSNPYETIRGAFFLNRAAVKMANIDRACDFMFTKPTDLQKDELLYFADVCAGPGGFSEYVLWRKKWHAKGFGFTLRNENDFKLDDFYAGPCETFHPYYGPKEDGDVFDPSNQKAFHQMIMKHTHGKGVHFMMSDGGFSVEGKENIQEILSKQLYLCQCLVALMIVRTGGNFVTKLFDLFTPFSAGLVYLMYRCFEKVCIFKPNTSRPANSERYLICKGKRRDTTEIMEYLNHVNHILLKQDPINDVTELVPLDELENEGLFVRYLRDSNEVLGRKQITGLLKIAVFHQDSSLIEHQQATMRKECLKYWDIPDDSRMIPRSEKPQDKLRNLIKGSMKFFTSDAQKLTNENIKKTILSQPYDWYCMPCASGQLVDDNKKATFYIGMGRRKVYRYIRGSWVQVDDITLELPPNTLLYAELVSEMSKERRYQHRTQALHILDAHTLGGEDISKQYILTRHELMKKFCEALWKPDASDVVRIRTKDIFPLNPKIDQKLHITQRYMKNCSLALTYEFARTPLDDIDNHSSDDNTVHPLYFVPNSVLFLRSTAQPWSRYCSKRHNSTYVFDPTNGRTLYDKDRPPEAEASFGQAFENRIVWNWPSDKLLTMETLIGLVREKCPNEA